jgi:hypothetical protein
VIKVMALLGAGHALNGVRPIWVGLIVGISLQLACVITRALRVRGTRKLPPALRQGLRGDHRNAALRWLRLGV